MQAALLQPLSKDGRWGAALLSRLLVRDRSLRERLLLKDEPLAWPYVNMLLRGTVKAWFDRKRKLEEVR